MSLDLNYIQQQLADLATAMLTSQPKTEEVTLSLEIPKQLINIAEYIATQAEQSRDEVLANMCLK